MYFEIIIFFSVTRVCIADFRMFSVDVFINPASEILSSRREAFRLYANALFPGTCIFVDRTSFPNTLSMRINEK